MDLEECKNRIREARGMISDAYTAVAPDKLKARRAELSERQNDPTLYSDPKAAQAVNSEAKYIDGTFEKFDRLFKTADDLDAMAELLESEHDPELMQELFDETDKLVADADGAQIAALLKGEYDKSDAILSLHAGAGGTEACDWCSMLYRMYTRWAERKGFAVEVLDYLDGDVVVKEEYQKVSVQIALEMLLRKKIQLRTTRIQMNNVQDKYIAAIYGNVSDIELTVRGRESKLKNLTDTTIMAYVDCSGLKEGVYTLPVKVDTNGLGRLVKGAKVRVIITRRIDTAPDTVPVPSATPEPEEGTEEED